MSLRTKINGFTAWVNLRLTPYNQLLSNVLMDLLTGTHMKYLLESYTGTNMRGLENMDGLTDQQKQTRVDWVVTELKKKNVIAEDVFVDARLFAMRSADQVFDLLWRMISHDIWFVWERAEYLQVQDFDVLTQVHFTWTPEPPPKKKKAKTKSKKSLLSGFGASISASDEKQEDRKGKTQLSWSYSGIDINADGPSHKKNKNKSGCGNIVENMFSNVETVNVSAAGQVDNIDGSDKVKGGGELQTENVDQEENSFDVERETEQKNNAGTDVENSPSIENNYTETDVYLEAENCLEDIDTGYNVNIGNEMSEPPRRELVSIYMIPLKDPDDPDAPPNTFSGRTSPWPLEDGTGRASLWTKESDYDSSQPGYENESTSCDLEEDHAYRVALDTAEQELENVMLEKNQDSTKLENDTDKTKDNQNELLKHSLNTDEVHLNNENSNIELLRLSLEQSLRLTKAENKIEKFKIGDWKDTANMSEIGDCSAKARNTSTSKGSNLPSLQGSNMSSTRGSKLSSRSGSSCSKSSLRNFNMSEIGDCSAKVMKTSTSKGSNLPSLKGSNVSSTRGSTLSSRSGSSCSKYSVRNSNDVQGQTTAQKVGTEETLIRPGARSRRASPISFKTSKQVEPDEEENWVKFPNAEYMKGFKKKPRKLEEYPSPDQCVLEMINYQLKITRDGKGLFCYSLDDFVDSRVLCALVNSFVPNTFTSDLLLNDRWTINLALKTAEKMFYAETPFDAEDLVEADSMAVSAYFAFFLMVAYRYRQTTAVVNRVDFINMLIRECNHELEKFPPSITNMQDLQRKKDVKMQLDRHRQAQENLQKKFDVDFCRKWVQHVEHVQNELRREIRDKMRARFEIVEIPRNITINDFCLAAVINLSLTNGSGFYLSTTKENFSDGRRLVLRNKETGEFIEDFTNKSKSKQFVSLKDALHIPDTPGQVLELNPEDYPEYERKNTMKMKQLCNFFPNPNFVFYFEAQSRNKQLKTGSYFLYQVFPGNTVQWQRLFIKSARDSEYETVEKMIAFFREDSSFINCREPKSGNTALHLSCRMGHFDVVRLLLENGANVDMKNNFKCTPVNLAIEALQRRICHYLVEWGCDVHSKNVKGQSVLETIKNDDFKRYLMDLYEYYSESVPKIMTGDMDLLDQVIADHASGAKQFCCLRSRIINGSTLLHTAAYYGHLPAIKELFTLRVDVNLRDYKGATPLHRAKNPEVMEILLEAGANVNAEDSEGNTPLHVKCYGETGKPSELDCIQMLLNKNVSLTIRNSRGLMPIHCCVMQGRTDVMQLLQRHDKTDTMVTALSKENVKKPPSLIHLALANDFIECAEWLLSNGFQFKVNEEDILMRRILTEQIKLEKRAEAIKFLLDNGAEPSPKYPGGNSALHYAAGLSGPSDVLELLVAYRAEIDAVNNDGCTPLFFATQSNNKFAACVLLEHGTNVRQKNSQGQTAFDFIIDFEDWIECGYFNEEIKARLKAYNLKHSRDLIRAISKRVKPGQLPHMRQDTGMTKSAYGIRTPGIPPQYRGTAALSRQRMLPSAGGLRKALMY